MQIINPYVYGGGGGGGVVIEEYTTETQIGVTSITATAPNGITANELLILIMVADTTTTDYATTPTGWTKMLAYSANSAAFNIFYKIASGGEGDVTVTVGSADHIAWYLRISGVDTSNPIDILGAPANNRQALSITTTNDGCKVFALISFDGGDGYPFSTSSTGWVIDGEAQAGTGGTNSSGAWAIKDLPIAGASGNCLFDQSSDGSCTVQFAIAPA